jgi:Glu-tRNA(Gln) amidotransferase subunit E-like FAD-binding protein
MEINIFTVWFFISPFIILHLYLKNQEYKDKANIVVQQINDVWDKDYKRILNEYGTFDNFLDCHKQDYDIIRNNLINYYSSVSEANRNYMAKTERLLSMIENGRITKDEIHTAIKIIRRDTCMDFDEIITDINLFIVNEEEAHSDTKECAEILDKIDKKYKNKNIIKDIT